MGRGSAAKARLVARSFSACISGLPPSVCGGGSFTDCKASAPAKGAPNAMLTMAMPATVARRRFLPVLLPIFAASIDVIAHPSPDDSRGKPVA